MFESRVWWTGLDGPESNTGRRKAHSLFTKDSDPGGQAAAKYVERSDRSRVIVQAEEKLGYFTIMRDRAASHRAQITLDWKERSDVEVLDLAAPSAEPDFT